MKLISLLLTPAAALILGGTANAQILNPIVVITRLGRAIQYSRCFDICTA